MASHPLCHPGQVRRLGLLTTPCLTVLMALTTVPWAFPGLVHCPRPAEHVPGGGWGPRCMAPPQARGVRAFCDYFRKGRRPGLWGMGWPCARHLAESSQQHCKADGSIDPFYRMHTVTAAGEGPGVGVIEPGQSTSAWGVPGNCGEQSTVP